MVIRQPEASGVKRRLDVTDVFRMTDSRNLEVTLYYLRKPRSEERGWRERKVPRGVPNIIPTLAFVNSSQLPFQLAISSS